MKDRTEESDLHLPLLRHRRLRQIGRLRHASLMAQRLGMKILRRTPATFCIWVRGPNTVESPNDAIRAFESRSYFLSLVKNLASSQDRIVSGVFATFAAIFGVVGDVINGVNGLHRGGECKCLETWFWGHDRYGEIFQV